MKQNRFPTSVRIVSTEFRAEISAMYHKMMFLGYVKKAQH